MQPFDQQQPTVPLLKDLKLFNIYSINSEEKQDFLKDRLPSLNFTLLPLCFQKGIYHFFRNCKYLIYLVMKFEYQIIWSGYINFSLRFKKWFNIFEKCKHGFKKSTILVQNSTQSTPQNFYLN